MKRAMVAFAMAMMAAAGVASALAPSSKPPQTVPRDAAGPPQIPDVAANPSKPLVEARQAPVPLMMRPRPTFAPAAPPPFDSDAVGPVPPKVGDGLAEGRAKAAVEADGYKGVKVLRRDADGRWRAEAMRGSTKVLLIVDAQGNVAQE
jgi:hypothetical protein